MPNGTHPRCIDIDRPEPVFPIDSRPDLCPPGSDRAVLRFLVRRVATRPGDLLSHVRRALLAGSLNDGEEAFAALVDLFIATGSKSQAVKHRLVGVCAPLLSPLQRQFLEKHCDTGLDAATPVSSELTVLTGGAGGGKAIRRHA